MLLLTGTTTHLHLNQSLKVSRSMNLNPCLYIDAVVLPVTNQLLRLAHPEDAVRPQLLRPAPAFPEDAVRSHLLMPALPEDAVRSHLLRPALPEGAVMHLLRNHLRSPL